ncbi:MAG: iron-containing alcohol dehydrogenase, partial [Firmicutes bacterium]|nr:iron-containing alcohol dehydrogenase [Bacillota bacterium]
MKNFKYYTPTFVRFGKGTENETGELLKKFGAHRVLVLYGSDRVKESGLLGDILEQMDELGIAHVELGGVVPNPRLSKVREGIALGKENNVDFVLAVGGGSVVDTAKAVGYGLPDDGDVWDFYKKFRKPETAVPVGAVLTLSATGSVMSDSSVISNQETGEKLGVNSDLCRPAFAVMDPQLTMSVSPYQTAAGSTDIMMHTLERYFNQEGNLGLTDMIAKGVLKTVMENTPKALEDPENYEARAEIMWAEALSHNGLTGCGSDGGDWACHKMEHELSAMYDVAHGAGLAAIWGTWARYVYRNLPDRFYKYAVDVMDVEPSDDREAVILKGIERTEDFFMSIGMPVSIRELGPDPDEDALNALADNCARSVGGSVGSAMKLQRDDMYNIFK